ncbi:glycogenin-1 isoform X9 [Danaus plexippus]|uniref:glycogenin-1 isoform X9 n=1 Tax=Danaus plexippus TaxID=13037 RepID=UPI002AB2B80B|nr:glycogenin-1 isoform X9 [Danaus plexippus]XP_061385947.1 glycogenin-1 isoform X9 [Danaus plexippus]
MSSEFFNYRAWVTLATNDSYGLGALVLAHSLRRASSSYPAVVLITPSVTEPMRERLRAVFAEVILVDVLDSKDAAHLALLQRPELGITFTKIHCWNLTQYEKCVFLDADTLIVQNCDELFEREELSAAPDVGWPDCFNSGVFVFKPSADTFSKLVTFASERGSFDGGDQGLLNSYFSDWARGDINKHLPFLYNVTSAAFYSYIPALKHYGQNLKIIHFIGAAKPWLQHFNWQSRSVEAPEHLRGFLQLWWDLFVAQVHSQLDTQMTGVAGNLAKVVPGEPQQQEAVDELTRRQGWEAGNIDYMGADSFDNIWAKISQTLSQPPSSPPRQPSPSNDQSVQPSEDRAVAIGEAKEAVVAPVESKPEEPVKATEEAAQETRL